MKHPDLIKRVYARRINRLFGGAVRATPGQVNDEAIRIADTMFLEICRCHSRLAPLAMVLDFIAKELEDMIPDEIKVLIGEKSLKDYLREKIVGFAETVINLPLDILSKRIVSEEELGKAKKLLNFAEKFEEVYLKYTDPNRKLQLCINVARRNWRSPMEIELLGL